MRENKFKVWDIEERCWIPSEYMMLSPEGKLFTRQNVLFKEETIAYKICFFTGLKDKNGKEIYEGNILQGSYGIPPKAVLSVVTFTDGSFINMTPKDNPKQVSTLTFMEHLDGEIIGNVYEDSNLLDKDELTTGN
jgi:uncharacterized phage protein (TIGR01671 family)